MALWTAADIETLKAAVSSGILTVRYDGPPARTLTYQSLAEMRELLAEMQVAVLEQTGQRQRYRLVATRKGL